MHRAGVFQAQRDHAANTHDAVSHRWCLVSILHVRPRSACALSVRYAEGPCLLTSLGTPVPSCQALHEQATGSVVIGGVCITTLQGSQLPWFMQVDLRSSSGLLVASCSRRSASKGPEMRGLHLT